MDDQDIDTMDQVNQTADAQLPPAPQAAPAPQTPLLTGYMPGGARAIMAIPGAAPQRYRNPNTWTDPVPKVPDPAAITQFYADQNLKANAAAKAAKQQMMYQWQRGLKTDADLGIDPAKSWARWAPLLASVSTPGEAAKLLAPPKAPPQPTPQQQQQMAMRKQAMAAAQAKVAAAAAANTPEALAKKAQAKAELGDAQRAVILAQQQYVKDPKPETKQAIQDAIKARNDLISPPAPPRPAGPPPVIPNVPPVKTYQHTPGSAPWPLPAAGGTISRVQPAAKPAAANEVVRVTKDGRKAVFDSVTKKFIRYADDANMGRNDSR